MLKRLGVALTAAVLMSVGAGAAQASNPALPGLTNLDFTSYTGIAPKGKFTDVKPTGWTGGSGLIYIDSLAHPGTENLGLNGLPTKGNPSGSVPGNYVEADGNPVFESGFNYEIHGLTAGQTYSLSFYQGASSQTGFPAAPGCNCTTNQWIVSLGTQGLTVSTSGGPNDPIFGPTGTYSNADSNASIAASQLMTVPDGGVVGWQFVSVDLTADAPDQLLSFLAWGDNGSTINLPPIAFLAGVNSPPGLGSGTPEPATWAMMLMGFAGVGGMVRAARRAHRPAVVKA